VNKEKFNSILILLFREKNKRWAEQGSAIVCLHYLKVYDIDYMKMNGILGE